MGTAIPKGDKKLTLQVSLFNASRTISSHQKYRERKQKRSGPDNDQTAMLRLFFIVILQWRIEFTLYRVASQDRYPITFKIE